MQVGKRMRATSAFYQMDSVGAYQDLGGMQKGWASCWQGSPTPTGVSSSQ